MDKHKKITLLLCAGLLAAVLCYISAGLRLHRMIAEMKKYAAEVTEISERISPEHYFPGKGWQTIAH